MSAPTFVAPKTITRQQIVDALGILGLDPRQIYRLTIDGGYVHANVLGVHEGGHLANMEMGELPQTSFHIPIGRE